MSRVTVAELRRAFDGSFAVPPATQRPDDQALLAIRAGSAPLAMSIRDIVGVSRCPAVTRLPSAQPALIGLAGLRGSLVTVYSIASLVGERPGAHRWLVLTAADPAMGLSFDELIGYERAPTGGVQHTMIDVPALVASIQRGVAATRTELAGLPTSDGE